MRSVSEVSRYQIIPVFLKDLSILWSFHYSRSSTLLIRCRSVLCIPCEGPVSLSRGDHLLDRSVPLRLVN
jgi:hypothetical protein